MQCPDCGYDNIDGVDTCEACDQPLIGSEPLGSEVEEVIAESSLDVLNPKQPLTVTATTTVQEAVHIMVERHIGCLLVEEDGQLVGIFSERDVLNKICGTDSARQQPVSEFMTASPETISAEDSVAYALHAMDLGGYRHLPIVDGQNHPVGIISVRDILRFLCNRFAQPGLQAD